ncbi:hypothetical protein TTHERM_00323000 (macronuclear) [Tetrahymena thermophila SB210]|uniref:C2H2-type domain-containing protein n=1 Tax=Tetrahymena thermophila (strain SB210) TaxID=312017 RepID=Q237I5_TETTS|nr:hypothetical protein TTHERM_00323000 [Tetrahymena thermophila SB210]EAR92756.1 hypothetical protein TTHERM_00323000 [Tetrahymena thermophila SB210]|eukprot:XP_001013001.1 hypothetical protein TTHERM_00323000 [Tetrahymena thermophila SB210]
MNSSAGFADSAQEGGYFYCKFDKCGRKFESETRLRDHQYRMHDKDILQQNQKVQVEMNTSNGSNMYKKDEQLKLPTISNNNSQISQSNQRVNLVQKNADKQDQLHPVIRQAQQIASLNNSTATMISNNNSSYSHQKKPSINSQVVKHNNSISGGIVVGSRPSSSSSSNFNTTSSSTNNIEFGIKENNIMKNSYLENSQVQQKNIQIQNKMDQKINVESNQSNIKLNISSNDKSQYNNGRITPNLMRKNNSQQSLQAQVKVQNSVDQQQGAEIKTSIQDKPTKKEERIKSKEEILFGKKGVERIQTILKDQKEINSKKQIQKVRDLNENLNKEQLENQDDSEDSDENDEDIANQINREDQILNMQFSDDNEDDGEESVGDNDDDEIFEEDEEEQEVSLNDSQDKEDFKKITSKEQQEILNKNNKITDKIMARPSPQKQLKGKDSNQQEKNDKQANKLTEKRKVSFSNQEIDLVKEKEMEELRKQSQIETQKILTSKFILEYTGYEKIEQVDQLFLRNKNLLYLKDTDQLDWSEFMDLQYLVVAHNPLLENIDCISSIPNHNLLQLNLEYNNIEDITPIFHHTQLQVLYLNGNRITSIQGINILSQLKTLALMKNKIKGFENTLNTLCMLSNLEELELEQNPVSSRFNYKYDLLWKLKLKKLDGEEVTDIDLELSRAFQKESLNYIQQKSGLPLRPGTAKDWGSRSAFNEGAVNSKSNYKDRFKQKINDLVQESKEVLKSIPEDRAAELEIEIELARQQQEQLEQELEILYCEQQELREKKDKLIKQNDEFQQQIPEFQSLQQQKNQLSQKYRSYVDHLKNNDNDVGKFIKEIFKLNLKLEDLQQENQELVIENNMLQQTQSKFFQSTNRPSTANKTMKQSKADFHKSLTIFNQIEQTLKQQQQQLSQPPKYSSKIYDDAEEVLSQDEQDEEQQQEQEIPDKKQNKILKSDMLQDKKIQEQKPENDLQEEEDEDDLNYGNLHLDKGFESEELDDDMKEIQELLRKNDEALKGVKSELKDF